MSAYALLLPPEHYSCPGPDRSHWSAAQESAVLLSNIEFVSEHVSEAIREAIGAPGTWVAAWRSRATLIPPPDVLDRIQEIIWEWHALYKEVKSLSRQIYGEDAEKWLHTSSPALGKRSPYQLRKTSSGLKRVLDLLRKSPSNRDHL
jgi:hypothetical protein